jgi:hypothetical protein
MQPRQLFGVLFRAEGVLLLTYSLMDLSHGISRLTGLYISSRYTLADNFWGAGFYFALGIVLIRGAERIVRFAYGPQENISN